MKCVVFVCDSPVNCEAQVAKPIITLTTDFGSGSPYVAAMKGAILSVNPHAAVVDLTHSIPPQDVRQCALSLVTSSRSFPKETIHVVVVDPGVGTERVLLVVKMNGHYFFAPDNGVLDALASQSKPEKIVALTESQFWLPDVSATFHGRDILGPSAAHLSLGVSMDQLGDPLPDIVRLDWPEVVVGQGSIEGIIESVDSFGNLITNIGEEVLGDAPRGESVKVICDEHETYGIFRTYGDQPAMTLIALVGSTGKLELAIVDDSAAIMLGVGKGATVKVVW